MVNKKIETPQKQETIVQESGSDKPKQLENVGGQAVLEGVMMRGSHYWAVAVRNPNGEIILKDHPIKSAVSKFNFLKLPLLRGVTALIENLVIGFKALNFSAGVSVGEDEKPLSPWHMAISFGISMLLVVVLFMAIPFFTTRLAKSMVQNKVLFTMIEGFIRISIFIGYVYLISLLKDIRRVFQYHGAEHKVVNAFENKEPLNQKSASKYSTIHVRCGTNFVIIVFIIAVVLFSFLPVTDFYLRIAGKILFAPIIAGVAYEIIRRASKTRSRFIKVIIKPGLWLQKLTTKEPDDAQVEVALASLERVLELEKNYAEENRANSK
ncbi:hypothetical protein LCGC14_0973060 [marine sediment metagenome]|uniref:DUF1385 domain-containing protein n=1 Tax=marine sediment metagenome TaxID=412755 RepID=A0A0F9QU93_9ZZZZ